MRRSTSEPATLMLLDAAGSTASAPCERPAATAILYGLALLRRGFSWGRQVRLSVIMYIADSTATWEVPMNFLQNKLMMWGGAAVIVLIVLAVVYGLPGGETPPAQ